MYEREWKYFEDMKRVAGDMLNDGIAFVSNREHSRPYFSVELTDYLDLVFGKRGWSYMSAINSVDGLTHAYVLFGEREPSRA